MFGWGIAGGWRAGSAVQRLNLEKFGEWLNGLAYGTILKIMSVAFVVASGFSLWASWALFPGSEGLRGKGKRTTGSTRVALVTGGERALDPSEVDDILKRNIFNHEGTLGDMEQGLPDEEVVPVGGEAVKSNLPFKVVGIIYSGDPFNGLAMLENTRKRRVESWVVGDEIDKGARLVEILESRVILDNKGRREYIEVEKKELVRSRRGKAPSRPSGVDPGVAAIAKGPPPDAYKEEGFERKGHDIVLTEQYKQNLLGPGLTKVLQDAKAEPNMVGGELKGFRLTRIREDSIYQKAGFQNNDIIREINGIPLRDAAGAIKLLQSLRNESEVEVRLQRGGDTFPMTVTIQ